MSLNSTGSISLDSTFKTVPLTILSSKHPIFASDLRPLGYNLHETGGHSGTILFCMRLAVFSEKRLDLQRKVVCTKERATPLNSKIIFLTLKVIEHNRMERQS